MSITRSPSFLETSRRATMKDTAHGQVLLLDTEVSLKLENHVENVPCLRKVDSDTEDLPLYVVLLKDPTNRENEEREAFL